MFSVLALQLLQTMMAGPLQQASARPRVVVSVRIENRVPLAPDALARISRGVRELWRPYADVTVATSPDGAAALPGDEELELVLTDRTLAGRDPGSVGWIEFVDGRPAKTFTVSLTAARMLMDAARWDDRPLSAFPMAVRESFLVSTVVRGISHEIGHYLLGSREHAAHGLMRPRFSAADILAPRPGCNRLDPRAALAITRHVLIAQR